MNQRRPLRRRLLLVSLTVLGVSVAGIAVMFGGFAFEMWTQAILGPDIEVRYGFQIGTPYVIINGEHIEVIEILSVVPGSAFESATLSPGEIIVSHRLIGSLYHDLDRSAGTEIAIEVVPGGDGPPIGERPRRTVRVVAP